MTDQPTDPTTRMPLPGAMPSSEPSSSAPPSPPPPAVPPPPPGAGALPPPAWRPARRRADDGRSGSIAFGLVILGLGLWFFASETLQLEMPDIEWRQAWPVILIAIGAWIVLGTLRRRA